MIRSFWKIHCEGWFGSSELAADGSAEAERASTQSSLGASKGAARGARHHSPPTSHKAHRSSSH